MFLNILLFVTIGILIFFLIRSSQNNKTKQIKLQEITEKYSTIIDIEKRVFEETENLKAVQSKIQSTEKDFAEKQANLIEKYNSNKEIFEKLEKEISLLQDELELTTFGVYKPQFDFDTSEKFKEEIKKIKDKQKEMLKNKNAATCSTEWTVSGSRREGQKMTKRNIKLMLRAFNGECDTAIAKVTWKNVEIMENRMLKTFEQLNKIGESNQITINRNYLKLKLNELFLTHEYHEKKNEEKEEQRRIREQIREEEKAQREYEKALKEAKKEEERYQKALEKAKLLVKEKTGEELDKLNAQIAELEEQLHDAEEKNKRAVSMAELTKSGHVYVISNIGSFGEDVYKIGLTRRLEPMDRVKELGDASVPFPYDVHAMIYSENAPELEKTLHNVFDEKRKNLVNKRKEFFDVTLREIEEAVVDNHGEIEFTKLAEAREYRESLAILKENQNSEDIPQMDDFPESLQF